MYCFKDFEVKPCSCLQPDISFGNLKIQSAQAIWDTPQWKAFSKTIMTESPYSICKNCFGIICRRLHHQLQERYDLYSKWFEYVFNAPFYPELKRLVDSVPDNKLIVERRLRREGGPLQRVRFLEGAKCFLKSIRFSR
ncbi:MAG: SPASM domain-containing protein [Deltaproteobacteria bacterium]|nr:SPASM domain-containing protein [Deltaproteobacteria bacterium]